MPLADPSSFLLAMGGATLTKKYIASAKKDDFPIETSGVLIDDKPEDDSSTQIATSLPLAAMKAAALSKVNELMKPASQNSSSGNLLDKDDEKDIGTPLWSVHSVMNDCPGASMSIFGNSRKDSDFAKNGFKDVGTAIDDSALPKPIDSSHRWMPYAIRSLSPLTVSKLDQQPLEVASMDGFSKKFLTSHLGGKDLSTGLYYPAQISNWKGKTYYLVNSLVDPFMPIVPGEHGAKLGVFFNDFDNNSGQYKDVPVFVGINKSITSSIDPGTRYYYMGTYSILRWSDRLDFDRVQEVVPKSVKVHWAEMLASPHKPAWLENAIRTHLWPRPEYNGLLPELAHGKSESQMAYNGGVNELEVDALSYLDELADWEQESKIKVAMLSAVDIMRSFEKVR